MRRKSKVSHQRNGCPLLSLSIIARNAGDTIHKPIESTRGLVDEVIVLDTGSTDDTREKARALGAKVFDNKWGHHFGEARTAALRKCRGKFVMWMDADEELAAEDLQHIKPLLEGGEYELIFCKNFVDGSYQLPEYELDGFGEGATLDKPRIFLNVPQVSWIHRVHENLCFQDNVVKQVAYTDIRVLHQGTMTQDKADYYRALLWLEKKDNPSHPHANLYLATYAVLSGEYARAIEFMQAIDQDLIPTWDEGLRKRYDYIFGQACQGMGAEATDQVSRDEFYIQALDHYSATGSAMARLQAAVIHIQLGRYDTARTIITRSLELDPAHLLLQALKKVVDRYDGSELEQRLSDFFIHLSQHKDPLGAARAVVDPVLEGPVLSRPPAKSYLDQAIQSAGNGRGLKLAKTLNIDAIRERMKHGQKESRI